MVLREQYNMQVKHRRQSAPLVGAILVCGLVACRERDGIPTGITQDVDRFLQVSGPITIDDRYAQIAELAPGFGGMYLEDGVLVVRSTQTANEVALRSAIRTVSAAARIHSVSQAESHGAVRFVGAEYDFRQLLAWKRAIRSSVPSGGAATYDADEVTNKVLISVPSAADREALQLRAANLGIPAGAVVFEIGTMLPAKDLSDQFGLCRAA